MSRSRDAANEITSLTVIPGSKGAGSWAQPRYDASGNMIRIPNPHQPDELLRCIYDGWNRMVEVQDQRGRPIAKYQYDGLNRRIVKQSKDSGGTDRWLHYFYSSDRQVIEERQASKASEQPTVPDRQHFWGVDGQLLFSDYGVKRTLIHHSGTKFVSYAALLNRFYVMRDALGSTTALLNESSELAGRFSYQPYGEPRALNNDFTLTENSLWHDFDYLFAGYRYDHETGLYHTRARQYHPLLGVWTSRDSAGYVDGLNLYEYVASSPTNFVDPSGEYLESAIDLASLAIGIASFVNDIEEGKWGWAILDAVGIAADAVALALPIVPGGVSLGVKGLRTVGIGVDAATAVSRSVRIANNTSDFIKVLDFGGNAIQTYDAYRQGNPLGIVLGTLGLSTRGIQGVFIGGRRLRGWNQRWYDANLYARWARVRGRPATLSEWWTSIAGEWRGWREGFADTGRYRWTSVKRRLRRSGWADSGEVVHHRILAQGGTRDGAGRLSLRGFFDEQYGRYIPNFVKNTRWNLQRVGPNRGRWTAELHDALHGNNPEWRLRTLARLRHGTTMWDRIVIGGTGIGVGVGLGYWLDG